MQSLFFLKNAQIHANLNLSRLFIEYATADSDFHLHRYLYVKRLCKKKYFRMYKVTLIKKKKKKIKGRQLIVNFHVLVYMCYMYVKLLGFMALVKFIRGAKGVVRTTKLCLY